MSHVFKLLTTALLLGLSVASDITLPGISGCKRKNAAPQTCGLRGQADPSLDYAIYLPQIVSRIEDCADLCARRRIAPILNQYGYGNPQSYCASFRYSTRTKLCQLSGVEKITNYVTPRNKSENVFFDLECFDCSPVCHQPYAAQLIDNGDFENRLFGPWGVAGSDIRKGYNSQRAYHCSLDDNNLNGCTLYQNFNGCFNESAVYRYKFDYLITASDTAMHNIRMRLYTERLVFRDIPITSTSKGVWRTVILYHRPSRYQALYDHSPAGEMSFDVQKPSDGILGDLYIDNVHVSRVPTAPRLIASQRSIIQNGGFESSELFPWVATYPEQYAFISPGIEGKVALSWHEPKGYSPSSSLSQKLITKPGTAYLFSFNAFLTGNDVWGLTIDFRAHHSHTEIFRVLSAGRHTFSYPVYAKAPVLHLTISMFQLNPGGRFVMDNFKMVEIDQSEYFP